MIVAVVGDMDPQYKCTVPLINAKLDAILGGLKDLTLVTRGGITQTATEAIAVGWFTGHALMRRWKRYLQVYPLDLPREEKLKKQVREVLQCANALIAFWDGDDRITGAFVARARKKGIPVRVVRYDLATEEQRRGDRKGKKKGKKKKRKG